MNVDRLLDVITKHKQAMKLRLRAKNLIWEKRLEEAKEALEEVAKLWPSDPDVHDDLSFCYSGLAEKLAEGSRKLDYHDRAIQESRHAISVNAAEPRFYTNLGLRLLRKGDPNDLTEVTECAQKALKLDPNFPSARILIQIVAQVAQQGSISQVLKTISLLGAKDDRLS